MNEINDGTIKPGHCKEVAIMGRFLLREFEQMDQKLGQESIA